MANDTGHKVCPKCGSAMVPMSKGNGFRCAKPGNRWVGGRWSLCDGVIWNNRGAGFFKKPDVIPRATSWPVIARPTAEQKAIKAHIGKSPAARGGRATIVDAGPGTAKTTTISWSVEAVYERLGNLFGYGLRAFNVNAANVLMNKLPALVPDISTLHSAGKAAQGHRGMANLGKIAKCYRSLVEHIPYKDRPAMGKIKTVLERCRNLCLWTTADDLSGWNRIVGTCLARFPSLGKKCVGQEKHLMTYLPTVAALTQADGRALDFSDMITRPVVTAMERTGWRLNPDVVLKSAGDWTDEEVSHFAKLIRSITLPSCSLVVDEAQDLDLAQIAVVLAQTWKTGELTLIGDDRCGNFGEPGFKAGQAIYGWRGAMSGSLTLIARLWKELTGESPVRLALTETFRHGPEHCAAYRPLNTVIRSTKAPGYSAAYACNEGQAFQAWLDLPEGATALWITRTNAAIVGPFLETLRNHEDCTIRGGQDFATAVDNALYEAAGYYGDDGEYKTDLDTALQNLRRIVAEMEEEGGEVDPNSMEKFMLEMGEAVAQQPELLSKAKLAAVPTVGNLRRFVLYFADKNSRRVLCTVYRCKGDEADLAVVADVSKFNDSWGDPCEDMACRHVALSRGRRLLLTAGSVSGSVVRFAKDGEDFGELFEDA